MDEKNELEHDDSAEESKELDHVDEKPVDDDTDAIQSALDDDFDVDAALASLESLGDALAEHQDYEDEEDVEDEHPVEEERHAYAPRDRHYFPRPPMTTLQRGQMGSVIPALVLIVVGAWWTFALTTSETPPSIGTVTLVLAAALGVMMLSHWFTSGRWAQGAFFGGVTLLAGAGVMVYLTQSGDLQADGYPLLLIAPGIGFLLTALLSQERSMLMGFTGVLLILAGLAALAVTTGTIDVEIDPLAPVLLPLAIGVLVALVILPVIFKRRA